MKRAAPMFALALPAVLLAGCATTAAPPAAQAWLAPVAWVAPVPPSVGAAELQTWWRAFDDPVLPVVVEATLAASPSLAGAAARIERARASRIAAAAALWPRADALAAAQQGRGAPMAPTVFSAQLGVQAAWELDLFGGLQAAVGGAQSRLVSAAAQAQGQRVALAAEAATTTVAFRSCEALLQLARDDAASREATAQLSLLTSRAGLSAPADAALASASAAAARSQGVAQQAACDAAMKSLVELTAWPEAALRDRLAAARSGVPRALEARIDSLPAALLQDRPDLIDAAAAVQAAAADRDSAVAAQRPQLSLAGSIGAVSSRSLAVTHSGSVWTIGPVQLSLPLFDAGARRANVVAARAEYDAAVVQARGQFRRAVREVEQALVALESTRRRGDDTQLAAEGFETALRATESRHRGGLASQFELEDARRNAVAARRSVIQLQQERAVAWIDLWRALGGGWQPQDLATTTAGR